MNANVVLQNNAVVVPPLRRHWCLVQALQGGLHPGAIGEHRAAPRLIGGIIEIRPHDLGERHGAMVDGFEQLIDDRHRWRLERRHARPIKNEPAARAREQAENDGMLAQNVLLEDFGSVVIELEHSGIQRQNAFRRSLGRAGNGATRNRRHVGRQILCLDG